MSAGLTLEDGSAVLASDPKPSNPTVAALYSGRIRSKEKDYPCRIIILALTSAFPMGTPAWTSLIYMPFPNRETLGDRF